MTLLGEWLQESIEVEQITIFNEICREATMLLLATN